MNGIGWSLITPVTSAGRQGNDASGLRFAPNREGTMGFWERFRGTPEYDARPTYSDRLRAATGIGTAKIRCHRDTWDYFIDEFEKTKSRYDSHVFRTRPEDVVDESNGMILVRVSGTTLAAVLDRCHYMLQYSGHSDLDKAIAARVERAILHTLEHVAPAAEAHDGEATVVLDDRPVAKPAHLKLPQCPDLPPYHPGHDH